MTAEDLPLGITYGDVNRSLLTMLNQVLHTWPQTRIHRRERVCPAGCRIQEQVWGGAAMRLMEPTESSAGDTQIDSRIRTVLHSSNDWPFYGLRSLRLVPANAMTGIPACH